MAKTNSLGVRLQPDVKAALEKAAKDDMRSLSSLMEKIVTEWLRERGYLPNEPKG
ncbi:MAG TPA: hypothetical protein VHL31_11510 [Geminicoccus sp.]|jgi:hypothetical protein|uniref:hypothetical protein n=1 Tax=Geminicoccus sp. TaxID=2024832 RepID=UPI002E354249|nr:hypothetical protein [Geminicoccus sp.]HEX2526906.1 hypothetical protein [Geminicoccus sp.]